MSTLALTIVTACKKNESKILDIGNCGLSDIDLAKGKQLDKLIRQCVNLETIILGNQWEEYDGFRKVTKFSENAGSSNHFSIVPPFIEMQNSVSTLILGGDSYTGNMGITDMSFIRTLKKLRKLYLGYNKIADIKGLDNLELLEELYLINNQISKISDLHIVKSLKVLNLSSNKIENITKLKDCTFLKNLHLRDNLISNIETIKGLTQLESIDLANNKIKTIPNFSLHINLSNLNLSSNAIEDMEPLLNLLFRNDNCFDLEDKNKIIFHNRILDINDNPLTKPPVEILNRGKEAIGNYFKELETKGKDYLFEAKMLIVGQPRAGKTSLRVKLFDNNAILPEEDATTRGIDIQSLNFDITDKSGNKRKFTYHVWDFGGQQIYQTTHQFFLTHRSLYVLVLDTGKDSIGNDDSHLNYWLQVVELLGGSSPLLLVKNEKNERVINIDMGQKKARFNFLQKDYSIDLTALSPGTPSFNEKRFNDFKTLKEDIETTLKRLPLVGIAMPKNWVDLRSELNIISKTNPYLNKKEFLEICCRFQIPEYERQMELSRIFHDLGIFLHFQDFASLEDFIVLKNTWATDAVFTMYDNQTIRNNNGKFTDNDLPDVWVTKGYEASIHKKLLSLMIQFELCYEVEKSKPVTYIIPEMLSNENPIVFENETEEYLQLQYRYDFMPRGILTRLIVRLHAQIEIVDGKQVVWKTGVYIAGKGFDCPETFAKVIEAWDNKKLEVQVKGPFARDLMSKITFQIDLLNMDYFKMLNSTKVETKSKWYKMIPCNCRYCRNRKTEKEKFFYDYDILQKALRKDVKIQCQMSFEEVPVSQLLDGIFGNDYKPARTKHRIFISYSKFDEEYKEEFIKHMITLKDENLVESFNCKEIELGSEWDAVIKTEVETCDIMICLVSVDFLNTEYIRKYEINRAIEANKQLIPIIIKPCDWENSAIGRFYSSLRGATISLNKELFLRNIIKENTTIERAAFWTAIIKEIRIKVLNA